MIFIRFLTKSAQYQWTIERGIIKTYTYIYVYIYIYIYIVYMKILFANVSLLHRNIIRAI